MYEKFNLPQLVSWFNVIVVKTITDIHIFFLMETVNTIINFDE
jgi:hypothetical protein